MYKRLSGFWGILAFALPLPAYAVDFFAIAGLASDSAASLEEIQPGEASPAANSDMVTQIEVGLRGNFGDNLTLSFDYASEDFSDYGENSSTSQTLSGTWETSVNDWSYMLDGTFIDMSLDGDDYLNMTMMTPSISLFADDYFFLGSAMLQEKSFDTYTDFDADATQLSVLAMRFFNSYRSNISVTFATSEEDAKNNNYDFDEEKITFGVSHRFPFNRRNFKAKLNYEMRSRDYTKVPDETLKSEEDRDRFRLRLSTQLTPSIEIEFEQDYKSRDANIAAASYDSDLTAIRFKFNR